MGQYLRDRKGFKKYDISDGEKDLTTPYLHLNSLNCDTMITDGWNPYFCFDHIITTSHFHTKINKTQLKELTLKGFNNFRVDSR